jgi:hypothetical protein
MQRIFIKKYFLFTVCLSCKAVHNWVEKFSEGHLTVANEARPGCPVETVTEAAVQRVEELIHADRRIMIVQQLH